MEPEREQRQCDGCQHWFPYDDLTDHVGRQLCLLCQAKDVRERAEDCVKTLRATNRLLADVLAINL